MNFNTIPNQRIDFSSPIYSYQTYPIQSQYPQQQQPMSYPIIQENNITNQQQHPSSSPPQQKPKSAELKFKIESVGAHPEDDDDLDMCPARTRPYWPKQIIPWWVPSHPNEKPPYSYATLIAHAILSSKDGRLTLNDIYTWISKNYPTFSVGNGGWQNSIRHNLSLNKKWFCKIDRRPTQANPGKGCYWTLIAGTEQIFIDNLTQEGGHSRKHHDIGLTAELSVGQRRGVCYYNHNPPPNTTQLCNNKSILPSSSSSSSSSTTTTTSTTTSITSTSSVTSPLPLAQQQQQDSNKSMCLDTPPLTPTKPEISRPLLSPLYTTFRMVDMTPKSEQALMTTTATTINANDSDNDSAVDLNDDYIDRGHIKKRKLIKKMDTISHINEHPPLIYDTNPMNNSATSFNLLPTSAGCCDMMSNWVEDSLVYPYHRHHDDEQQSWMLMTTPIQQHQLSNNWSDNLIEKNKKYPITINLDDEEITQKYLHFTEEEEEPQPQPQPQQYHPNDPILSLTDPIYYNPLYPPYNSNTIVTPSTNHTSMPQSSLPNQPTNNYPFNQFVSMQDILYS